MGSEGVLLKFVETSRRLKFMNPFQECLQDLLNDYSISRKQLARAIGLNSSSVNAYFNIDNYPSIENAIKIADYFSCSLDYLFGFSDTREIKFKINKENINKAFIANFEKLIKENNLSIAHTMRDLGMSEFNFYRWRKGDTPKTMNLLEIAKYFDVTLETLLKE